LKRKANFSRDRQYRYLLERVWDDNGKTVLFIMLNPSTADHKQDDPTIRRCMGFAQSLGFKRLIIANLFAYKATKPEDLVQAKDPVGKRNMEYLRKAYKRSDLVITAWGNPSVIKKLKPNKQLRLINKWQTHALGHCKDGHPRHPLYLRKDADLLLNEQVFEV